MPGVRVSNRSLPVLLLAFALVWFGTLDYRKLIKPDEGRYAEIAREMAASGDWVTPRLNGIKYFEKPPLQYWATAAAFKAFGENEWTARLWCALTGFLGVLVVSFTGRRLFGRTAGVLAAAALGSSLFYLALGHLNTLDMGVSFFLTCALCAFLSAQSSPAGSAAERRWMLVAWLAMAGAVLSKGLVGLVFPAATLVLYSIVKRDTAEWRRLHIGSGVLLFALAAAPWFIAVSLANPEFPRFFFIHEHFERFLTTTHRRYQPWWYFGPVLALGLLPWTSIAMATLVRNWRSGGAGCDSRLFLALWAILIFVFFSASGSKLPSYVLPILPALALLCGDYCARAGRRSLEPHLWVIAAIAVLALVLLPQMGSRADAETPLHMIADYQRFLTIAALALLCGAVGALWLVRRERCHHALLLLAAAGFSSGMIGTQGHESLAQSNSAYHIARKIAPSLEPGVAFYSVRMYDQTLTFYLRRTVMLVEYTDEMGFGLEQEPQLGIPTLAQFEVRWRAEHDAFAVMDADTYSTLDGQGLPMQIVAKDTRRVIVRRPNT
jgi:4-amino-4-deoxy-L-arabinose transferase-like glycosyltransferase